MSYMGIDPGDFRNGREIEVPLDKKDARVRAEMMKKARHPEQIGPSPIPQADGDDDNDGASAPEGGHMPRSFREIQRQLMAAIPGAVAGDGQTLERRRAS